MDQANTAHVIDVEPSDVARLAKTARIIDVREPDEFTGALGHLDSAELVPLATVEASAARWDPKQPILLVCRSGRRSLQAGERLLELGFEHVMNLRGGMQAVRAQPGSRP